MSEDIQNRFIAEVKQNSGLTIGVGAVVLLMGILAMGAPFVAGLSIAIMVGISLIIGGAGQLVFSVKSGKSIFSLILGVLTVLTGGYMMMNPAAALASLTLFLAGYLIVSGITEALMAFQLKPVKGWGWSLLSGIVSVLLGAMIWSQFPLSGAWTIGVLIGVKLMFSGLTLLMIGFAAGSMTQEITDTV